MPSPPIMNLGTGIDTQSTIKQLLELEKIPIKRMEEDNIRSKIEIRAWEEVKSRVQTLSEKSSLLYSFAGPFSRRLILSSDPGAVTGEAAPGIENLIQKMEILKLASKHKIYSSKLNIKKEIPAGKFSIESDGKKIQYNFTGGSPSALLAHLRSTGTNILEASGVRVDSSNEMIVLQSVKEGEAGKLQFDDPDGVLQNIGLIHKDPGGLKDFNNHAFVNENFVKTDNAVFSLKNDGKSLELNGSLRYSLNIPANSAIKISSIVLNNNINNSTSPSTSESPSGSKTKFPVVMGPEITVEVGDIKLKGQQIGRELYLKDKASDKTDVPENMSENPRGIGIIWKENDKEKIQNVFFETGKNELNIKLKDISGDHDVTGIFFYSGKNNNSVFSDMKISEKKKSSEQMIAANESTPASDAVLKINGVEVKRSSNKGIDDIIKGASLNLNRITSGEITVEARSDSENIVKTLNEWVTAYNDLLKFCRDNSRPGNPHDFKANRPTEGDDINDGLRKIKENSGIFASDSTIRQLITTLQIITSESYPSGTTPEFRVLSDIGISTGKPGLDQWKQNKEGYLQIETEKLLKALNESSFAVKELFSSDTNEDNLTDNGVAFKMRQTLQPYSRLTGGLISVRIDLLNTKISDNKDRINNKELSLKKTEEKLRSKFGHMESSIKKSQAVGRELQNQLKNSGN